MKKWVSLIVVMLLVFSSFDWRVFGEEDLEPPTIISHSIQSGSFTIGETVKINVSVKDNLSPDPGVRMFLVEPKSGYTDFYVPLKALGNGHYASELTIKEGMEEGEYKLYFLQAWDDHGNSTMLWGEENTQGFTVYDTNEDMEAPQIVNFKIESGPFTIGEKVGIEIEVKDNLSVDPGVRLFLVEPKSGDTDFYVPLKALGNGRYASELTIKEGMEEGEYKLYFLQAWDDHGNSTMLWGEESAQGFELKYPSNDLTKPTFISIEKKEIILDEYVTKSFTINAEDDLKLKSVQGTFTHDNGETVILSSDQVTSTGFEFPISYYSFRTHPGRWRLSSLTISDLNQNTLTVTEGFDVSIQVLPIIDRTPPVISGISQGQVTNQSVTIQYNEGTATLNGKRIRNNWAVKNSGVYTLRVTDKAGNVKLLTFTIDKTAPTKPTISTLTNKSTLVFGKAEKGATVYITYNGRTYTTKASSRGLYRYKLKTTKAGATVSARAKDAAGNMSGTASRKVLNTFRTFSVNSVKSTSNVITGKGNKGATVKAYVGTKLISKTAKVDSKGNYRLTISRQKPGVTVTVKMTQSGYQELKKTTRVVK